MNAKNNPAPETHKLVITRELAAPRDIVWKAWTTPAHVKQWMELDESTKIESVQMDLRAGGRFRLQQRMADGEYFTAAGTYLEVSPPDRLVYTWDWEKDGAGPEFGELEGKETQVTVEFFAIGPQTRLVLTHEKFDSVQRRDNHQKGWTSCTDRFAKFVEAK